MEHNRDREPVLDALYQVISTLSDQALQPGLQTGYAAESEPPPPEVLLPENIHDLLDGGLEEVEMGGEATTKYRVAGHPELLVRHTEGVTRAEQIIAYQAARAYSFHPTPTEFVTHKGRTYAVTKVVDGAPLDELLAQNPSPELLAVADQTMATIATNLQYAHHLGTAWPADAQTPNQFMWGTIPGDTQPRVWLVDLPVNTYTVAEPDEYGIELLYDISGLLQAEQAAGQELPLARRAFGEAIVQAPDSERHGDGFRNAGAHCLINGQNMFELPGDEYDFVDLFRTY